MSPWSQALGVFQASRPFCASLEPQALAGLAEALRRRWTDGPATVFTHRYAPQGFSWSAVGAHCRITVHSWPELGQVTWDCATPGPLEGLLEWLVARTGWAALEWADYARPVALRGER